MLNKYIKLIFLFYFWRVGRYEITNNQSTDNRTVQVLGLQWLGTLSKVSLQSNSSNSTRNFAIKLLTLNLRWSQIHPGFLKRSNLNFSLNMSVKTTFYLHKLHNTCRLKKGLIFLFNFTLLVYVQWIFKLFYYIFNCFMSVNVSFRIWVNRYIILL